MAKRLLALLSLVALLLAGCGREGKIREENLPGKHLKHYDSLTALYGSGKMDTLNALGIKANDVEFVDGNNNIFNIHRTEEIDGISLDTILYFTDSLLSQVNCEKTYSYPDEMEQAISDAMHIAAALEKKLGKPHGVDNWNDNYEEEHNIEMDQKTPAYQSADQIRGFLEGGLGGSIMKWDMTSVACPEVEQWISRYDSDDLRNKHLIGFYVRRDREKIVVGIGY